MGEGELVPGDRPRRRSKVRRAAEIRDDDGALDARNAGEDVADTPERVEGCSVVAVAVRAHEHLGLDLPEAVEHPLDPEVGRARGPHRPEAGSGQHGDDGFREVREIARDPVTGADPGRAQALRCARHVVVELAPGDAPVRGSIRVGGRRLPPKDDGRPVVAAPQEVLRVVQSRTRKPARAGHPAAVLEDRIPSGGGEDPAEVPDALPECGRFGHRPGVKRGVVRRLQPVALAHEGGEPGDLRPFDVPGARLPERLRHARIHAAAFRLS